LEGEEKRVTGDSSLRNFEGCLIASKLVTRLRSRDAQLESYVINGTFKKGRALISIPSMNEEACLRNAFSR